jgi:hypothetical protein
VLDGPTVICTLPIFCAETYSVLIGKVAERRICIPYTRILPPYLPSVATLPPQREQSPTISLTCRFQRQAVTVKLT